MKHPFLSKKDATSIREITPEVAEFLFTKFNTHNRPLDQRKVRAFAQAIRDRKWHTGAHDAISFYTDGTLANGQHRLKAIMDSGITIQYKVNVGVSLDTKFTPTAERSFKDLLCMQFKNNTIKSCISGLVMNVWRYRHRSNGEKATWAPYIKQWESKEELFDFYGQHSQTFDLFADILGYKPNPSAKRAGFLVAVFEYYQSFPDKAEQLLRELASNCSINPSDWKGNYAPKKLFDYFISHPAGGDAKVVSDFEHSLSIIKAFHNGKEVKTVGTLKDFPELA